MVSSIGNGMKHRKEYIKNAADENAESNFRALKIGSGAAAIFSTLFLITAPRAIEGRIPLFFAAAMVLFCFAVFIFGKRGDGKRKGVAALCIVFEAAVFTFTLLTDTAGGRSASTGFMPLLCVAFPICFIFPLRISYGIVLFFEAAHLAADLILNGGEITRGVISEATGAVIFSLVTEHITTSLRIRLYETQAGCETLCSRDMLMPEIYNKQSCRRMICEYLDEHNPRVSAALIIIDLDNFKIVNDTFGHIKGDCVLRCAGEVILEIFRPTGGIAGRFGGDEFIVFIPGEVSEKVLSKKCGMVKERLRERVRSDLGIAVSCSIGAVLLRDKKADSFEKIFMSADAALYEAKDRGKNCFSIRTYGD